MAAERKAAYMKRKTEEEAGRATRLTEEREKKKAEGTAKQALARQTWREDRRRKREERRQTRAEFWKNFPDSLCGGAGDQVVDIEISAGTPPEAPPTA